MAHSLGLREQSFTAGEVHLAHGLREQPFTAGEVHLAHGLQEQSFVQERLAAGV